MIFFSRLDIRDQRIKHMEETIDKCFKTIESMNADYLKSIGKTFVLHNLNDQLKAENERLKMELECAQLNLSIAVGVKDSQRSELNEVKAENEKLSEEVALGDKLIADRDRLMNMFECPAHGQCVPYAMEQVGRLKAAVRTLEQLGYADNGGEFWKPPIGHAPDFNAIEQVDELRRGLMALAQYIGPVCTKAVLAAMSKGEQQ